MADDIVNDARGFAQHLRIVHAWDEDAALVDRLADEIERLRTTIPTPEEGKDSETLLARRFIGDPAESFSGSALPLWPQNAAQPSADAAGEDEPPTLTKLVNAALALSQASDAQPRRLYYYAQRRLEYAAVAHARACAALAALDKEKRG